MSTQPTMHEVLLKRIAMARDLADAAGPDQTVKQWVPQAPTAYAPAGVEMVVKLAEAYRAEADGMLWALTHHGVTRVYSADAAVQAAFDRGLQDGLGILRSYRALGTEAEA